MFYCLHSHRHEIRASSFLPGVGELCGLKPGDTPVEACGGADVQIVRPTWVSNLTVLREVPSMPRLDGAEQRSPRLGLALKVRAAGHNTSGYDGIRTVSSSRPSTET